MGSSKMSCLLAFLPAAVAARNEGRQCFVLLRECEKALRPRKLGIYFGLWYSVIDDLQFRA